MDRLHLLVPRQVDCPGICFGPSLSVALHNALPQEPGVTYEYTCHIFTKKIHFLSETFQEL
jgi:hypothetical protein